MTTTINAAATTGLSVSSDGSGIVKLQSNGVATNALAWVRFNGSGVIAASYNVSSLTSYGSNVFGINFTNPMADANYAVSLGCGSSYSSGSNYNLPLPCLADGGGLANSAAPTTTQVRIIMFGWSGGGGVGATTFAFDRFTVAIFGN